MADFSGNITVGRARKLTLDPVDVNLNPTPLDESVPVQVTVLSGSGRVRVDPNDPNGLPLLAVPVGTQVDGLTVFGVGGDPDHAPGQQTLITATIEVRAVAAQAIGLGVGLGSTEVTDPGETVTDPRETVMDPGETPIP